MDSLESVAFLAVAGAHNGTRLALAAGSRSHDGRESILLGSCHKGTNMRALRDVQFAIAARVDPILALRSQ